MHDVAFLEWSVLPPQQAGVVLVDEQRHVRSQFAVFVAEALGQARVSVDQRLESFAEVGCVERDLARAAGESAEGAVQQHPHARTTNGRARFRHPAPP